MGQQIPPHEELEPKANKQRDVNPPIAQKELGRVKHRGKID